MGDPYKNIVDGTHVESGGSYYTIHTIGENDTSVFAALHAAVQNDGLPISYDHIRGILGKTAYKLRNDRVDIDDPSITFSSEIKRVHNVTPTLYKKLVLSPNH